MAVTLGSTGITFPDATTQTTAATGGGALQVTLTAASAITAGQVVQYTTGTNVEAVAGVIYTQSVAGSGNTTNSSVSTNKPSGIAFDNNTPGSFVSFGVNSSGYSIQIVAGTLSNNTATVGTPIDIAGLGTFSPIFYTPKVMFDPVTAGKCMLIVQDSSSNATPAIRAFIFTVSGNTITLQSSTTLLSASYKCAFSYYGQDTFVYTYLNSTTLYAVACSISTYTITQGTATSIATSVQANDSFGCIDLDYSRTQTNQLVGAYFNGANFDAYAVAFTVTPATKAITAGSAAVIISGITANRVSIACDPLVSRIAVSATGTSSVTVGGALISAANAISSAATWTTLGAPYNQGTTGSRIAFTTQGDGTANSSVLAHYWTGNVTNVCCIPSYYIYFRSGILVGSGTPTITWGAYDTVITTTNSSPPELGPFFVTNQTGKFPLLYLSSGANTNLLKLGQAGFTDTNLNPTNLVGVANASASAAASVVVNTWGSVVTNQTGLTVQSNYYVDQTGTLTTSSTSPNVSIGKALSSTSILLKTLTV